MAEDGWGDRLDDYPWETAYQLTRRDMEERAAAQSRAGQNLAIAFGVSVMGFAALLIWWFLQ